jgi:hypothetical protein
MKPSLETILLEAVNFEASTFDDDRPLSGGDLVEWFSQWRLRARSVVENSRHSHDVALNMHRFRRLLMGALHALQIMGDRAEIEEPLMQELTAGGQCSPPTDAEIDALIQALEHGGIHITAGQFTARVFKQPARGPS